MSDEPLKVLIQNNASWAARIKRDDPSFFDKLSQQQAPEYLWIGCSDSRVPANQIVGLLPGEVFVHRNVANLVVQSDLNCLSAIQYAVDILRVRHIIVCGHYGCGGVDCAMHGRRAGLADNWLGSVRDAYLRREDLLGGLSDKDKFDAVCEMNVIDQVRNVALSTVLQDAWARGQDVGITGLVYGIHDGLLRTLITAVKSREDMDRNYKAAIDKALSRKA